MVSSKQTILILISEVSFNRNSYKRTVHPLCFFVRSSILSPSKRGGRKLGAYMKRVAAGAHLPISWLLSQQNAQRIEPPTAYYGQPKSKVMERILQKSFQENWNEFTTAVRPPPRYDLQQGTTTAKERGLVRLGVPPASQRQ